MRAEQQSRDVAYAFAPDADSAREITYAELGRQASAIACMLADLGIPGQRALLLYPPGIDYIAAFFGCLQAGVIAVPGCPPDRSNPLRLARSLRRLVAVASDAMPTAVLTTAAMSATIKSLHGFTSGLFSLRVMTTDDMPAEYYWSGPPAPVSAESEALFHYTPSAPKGAILTHRNLMSDAELTFRSCGYSRESRGVTWLPPHHDTGLIGGIIQPMYGGFPVTLLTTADFLARPLRWLQEISRTRATTSGGPGFAYDLCVKRTTAEERRQLDLSSWRVAFNGSAPIRARTIDNFARAFEPAGFSRDAFHRSYRLAGAEPAVTDEAPRPAVTDKDAVRLYCWIGGSRVPVHAAAGAGAPDGWRLGERPRRVS